MKKAEYADQDDRRRSSHIQAAQVSKMETRVVRAAAMVSRLVRRASCDTKMVLKVEFKESVRPESVSTRVDVAAARA